MSRRKRDTVSDSPSDLQDHGPKARWRRAALKAVSGKTRAVTIVAVLPPFLNEVTMETSLGNARLMEETSLEIRSVQLGLRDLVEAKQIEIEVKGPRRTIRAIVPPAPETQNSEQDIRGKREQDIRGKGEKKHECFRREARTRHTPIVGSRLPLPPRTELQRSVALAALREETPFRPGEFPAWMGGEASPLLEPDDEPLLPFEKPLPRSGARSTPGQNAESERCKLDRPANSSTVQGVEVPHAREAEAAAGVARHDTPEGFPDAAE